MMRRPSRSRSRLLPVLAPVFVVGVALTAAAIPARADSGDDLSRILQIAGDDGLRAQGMDYAIQQIDFLGRDGGHSTYRWLQKEFRWVRGDARRGTTGLGVLVDGAWTAGPQAPFDLATLTAATSRAGITWRSDPCLTNNRLREVAHPGGDVTIFDFLLGIGDFGDPFAADIVVAGPEAGLEAVFGDDILAFSVTFVFVGPDGTPTDVDKDNHLDTAHSEIYLNPAVDWTTAGTGVGIDLETAMVHELGHSIGLGHFGSPPESVMTPVYAGVRRALFPIDHAALCLVYGRRP